MKKIIPNDYSLVSRLAAYAASSGALMLIAGNVNSQVVYSGPQNLQIVAPEESLLVDLDGDTIDDFKFIIYASSYGYSSSSVIYAAKFAYGAIYSPRSDTYNSWITKEINVSIYSSYNLQVSIPAALQTGIPVSEDTPSWTGVGYVSWMAALGVEINKTVSAYSSYYYSVRVSEGDFNGKDGFLGVRFKIGDDKHYGWIRVEMTENLDTLTVMDWAYESTPGEGIIIGDGLGLDLPPWISISGNEDSNIDTTIVTFTATEEITGFDISDITITNGTASDFTETVPGFEYTLQVVADAEGEVVIEIPEDAVTDLEGNGNPAISHKWNYDITAPVASVNTYTDYSPYAYMDGEIFFSEPVSTLNPEDLIITNGTLNYLEMSAGSRGQEYTFAVTTTNEGEAQLQIPEGAVTDEAGNMCSSASISWQWDATPPIATVEVGFTETSEATVEVSVSFNEPVTGLAEEDFNLVNAEIISLTTVNEGTEYTLTVISLEPGAVSVSLKNYCVWDGAGNYNESALVAWDYVSSGLNANFSDAVRLYPNPASDIIHIVSDFAVDVRIFDLQGNLILQEKDMLNSGLDVSGLAPGMYLINVQHKEQYFYRKLVIR